MAGTNNSLHVLVHSMNTNERAAFKKQQAAGTHHINLYNWLLASDHYTPDSYKAKLKEQGCKRSYANVKQYLRGLIEHFLLDYRKEKYAHLKLAHEYATAILYKDVGMNDYALKLLQKTKQNSTHYRQYDFLAKAIHAEIHINNYKYGYGKEFPELFEDVVNAMDNQKALYQLAHYGRKLNNFQIHKHQKDYAPEEWQLLKDEFDGFRRSVEHTKLVPWAQMLLHEVMGMYWRIEMNMEECHKAVHQAITVFKAHPELIKARHALAWTMAVYMSYSADPDFQRSMLPEIKDIVALADDTQPLHDLAVWAISLKEMHLLHKFDGLDKAEATYLEGFTNVNSWMLVHEMLLLSLAYKKTGQIEKAQHYLQEHLELAKQAQGGTQESVARIIELLYLVDDNNEQLLYHRLNAFKQFVRNQQIKTDFEQAVINFMHAWLGRNDKQSTTVFEDMLHEITTMKAPDNSDLLFQTVELDLRDWLQAHIEGVTFAEYLDSQRQTD